MKALFTPFKVGLLVLASSVSLVWMGNQVREGITENEGLHRAYALFKDVGGLAIRSKVVIAGITIGQIEKIELAGMQAKVWVKLKIPLKTDARIAKRQASLLGESYLQLAPGYQGSPIPDRGQIIHVDYDVSPADLMEEVREIMGNVNEITLSLKKVVAGENGEQRLVSILENINRVVNQMNKALTGNSPKIDKVVNNVIEVTNEAKKFTVHFRKKADQILEDAQLISENARVITTDVRQLINHYGNDDASGIKGAVLKIKGSLARLDSTLEHTRSIAQKVDEGQGSLGQLVNNDRLVKSITSFVDESSRFVSRLTRLQFQVAMSSEYYFQDAVAKNYFELRMIPKPDKYYLLQLVDSPARNTRIIDRMTTTTANGMGSTEVSEREVITEDRFLVTLQFAKRFHFLTGRVGLLESSGAIGLDASLFSDSLNIVSDLFEFAEERNPRLRVRATYEFFTHLYVAAGVDDVLNENRLDYFLGGGIRFNDEDLQAILATAPTPAF
jgi:phospholipid/cholesterol/gamma-HCH transport system substrate-binding protein